MIIVSGEILGELRDHCWVDCQRARLIISKVFGDTLADEELQNARSQDRRLERHIQKVCIVETRNELVRRTVVDRHLCVVLILHFSVRLIVLTLAPVERTIDISEHGLEADDDLLVLELDILVEEPTDIEVIPKSNLIRDEPYNLIDNGKQLGIKGILISAVNERLDSIADYGGQRVDLIAQYL